MKGFKTAASRFVALAVVSMVLAGCAGNKSFKEDTGDVAKAKSIYPAEFKKLMDGKYANSIKGVGIATHADQVVAKQKAELDADQQLAEQFQMEISALQKKFLEAVNDQKLEEYKNTVENFVNIKIRGATIMDEMETEGRDGYKAYVLKVVSAETLKGLIDEQTNALTNFKALQAYKELEDRVVKDNEAKAKSE